MLAVVMFHRGTSCGASGWGFFLAAFSRARALPVDPMDMRKQAGWDRTALAVSRHDY